MRSLAPLFALAIASGAPALATEVVPVPAFRSVELRGGGEVTVVPGPAQRVTLVDGSSRVTRVRVEPNGQLKIDACAGQCPTNYRLRIEIQSPRVPDLAVSRGGQIAIRGSFAPQRQLAAAVDRGGRIDARSVEAAAVTAAISSGGEITVHPRASLTAAVNRGGLIRFLGHPQVTSAVHAGGLVRPLD